MGRNRRNLRGADKTTMNAEEARQLTNLSRAEIIESAIESAARKGAEFVFVNYIEHEMRINLEELGFSIREIANRDPWRISWEKK
jgi:hypothetical protein